MLAVPRGACQPPVGLIARMMAVKVRAAVEGKIREREWCGACAEARHEWRIGDEIRRLLVGCGERVRRALTQPGRHLMIERHPANAVAALEERIEIRPSERGLSRRADVLALAAADESDDGGIGDGQTEICRQGGVVERAVRLAIVGRESLRAGHVIEAARRARRRRPAAHGAVGSAFE